MQRHLVHVGFPKAGSTTLQAWFASRPELVFAHEAIAGVTSADEIVRHVAAAPDDAPRWVVTSAERLIAPAVEGAGIPYGAGEHEGPHVLPREAIAPRRERVCARLRAMFGDATILIVTRGFRGIMASAYSQTLRWGPALSVEELVALYQEDPAFGGVRAADTLNYDAAIRLYMDTFGADNVMVLPYELLRDDPREFFARLEQRLSLEPRSHEAPWLNPSLSGPELYWYPRVSRRVERIADRFGDRGTALRRNYYQRVVRAGRLRRPVEALSRISSTPTVRPADHIPAEVVETCRGLASSLATNPDYAPYAAEYLNDRDFADRQLDARNGGQARGEAA
jgi:hypothetical protein